MTIIDSPIDLWYPVLAVVFLWFFYLAFRKKKWIAEEGMPVEIAQSKLYKQGGNIRCRGQFPMHGTPDTRYLTKRKALLLVESKSRGIERVYPSDIIQISTYGYIERHSRQSFRVKKVESYGYIRLVLGKEKRVVYKRVELLCDKAIEQLHNRHEEIMTGRAGHLKKARKAICKGCDYRKEACSLLL